MLEDYRKARKLGLKQVSRDVSSGRYPYPPALDDILKGQGSQGEVPIGVEEIDIALIAGTKTRGRQNSFSTNFMPLPDTSSEFASKWSDLIDSQREEGIRDPILCYEYLQHFYVQEGNKRVSVMSYLGMPTISASIVRVIPMPSDEPSVRIYQEFMQFYSVAPIYGITFSEEGSYARLAALMGQDLEHPWPDDLVRDLRASFGIFAQAYRDRGGQKLGLEIGDAYLAYLKIYGFNTVSMDSARMAAERVDRAWDEFVVSSNEESIAYLEDPATGKHTIIPELKTIYKQTVMAKPFRVSFIYERNPFFDGWCALHERGRKKLEGRLGATVVTEAYADCEADDDFAWAVDSAIEHGSDLVVTIAPTQMPQALRAAVKHPGCAFINCSVSLSHSAVRTFSGRLYEAKFLLGALAASLSESHRVGYVAETPVFGSVAEINAFALGAAMVDPFSTVYLKWFSAKDYDWKRELAEADVRIVSGRDYADPARPDEDWGLYRVEDDGSTTHLAEPVWKWGRYYELIVKSIRSDIWRKEQSERRGQALNYWWGMSAGILDVKLSEDLPYGQRALVEVLRQSMLTGRIDPFAGELVNQEGVVEHGAGERLTSEEIVRMRWLNANVVGRLPEQRELSEDGLEKVEVAGLIPLDPATPPRKGSLL